MIRKLKTLLGIIATISVSYWTVGCSSLVPASVGTKLIAPTFSEAQSWRDSVKPTLINGQKVKPTDYPAVIWFGHCTGSLIGPRTVLTAAHCIDDDNDLKFSVNGVQYSATPTISPLYVQGDHDLALGYVDKVVENVKYRHVQMERDARKDERLQLTGFGCTDPGGGGGGNDGTLRVGYAVLSSPYIRNYDLILKPFGTDKSALCFGDSGGPVFRADKKQIAVNSKGNILDTSYVTRTDHPDSKSFFSDWAATHSAQICGLNSECLNDSPKEPIQFTFENKYIQLQGVIKGGNR